MLATTAIYDLMSDLLDSMTAYLASASPGPALTVPERHYVHLGQVAYDEEQLVISANRVYLGTIDNESIRDVRMAGFPRTVVMEVLFLMCVPSPDANLAPTAEKLDQSTSELLTWGVALGNALWNAYRNDAVFNTCAGVAIGPSVPVGPEGTYGGWSTELRVGF